MKSLAILKHCLMLIIISLFMFPTFTEAAANLEVKVEYGVDNKVQMGKGHPIRIEVINKGDAVKGDFVIFSSPTYNMAGSYVIPIELEAGGSKTIELSVKGTSDHFYYGNAGTKNNYVSFFEGGVKKGKEVKLKGNVTSQPRFIGDNRVVLGVLSNNHDAVNFLKLYKYQSESMELLNINKDNIPGESFGLEMFDVLIVHDFPLSTLTSDQQQAIKNWVHNGGSLIFDTKVGLSQDLGELKEFLLLEPKNETTISSLNQESNFPDLPIFTGDVLQKDALVVTKDKDIPITLVKNIGTGTITQITGNLASPVWGEWKEGNSWWTSVLQKATTKTSYYRASPIEELTYQLSPIGEAFPGSIVSVPLLIGAFIVYLILLIPVLYFILKKADKREQAWWIIPAIAIFTSVSVFGIGAKDRLSGTQVNESSILTLDNQTETVSGYGVTSILTNSGGNYTLETNQNASLFPVMYGYRDNFDMMKNYAFVHSTFKGTDITFNDVEYWSTRTSLGNVSDLQVGKVDYSLTVNDGKVQGTVSNQLKYEWKDVFLLSGRNAESLGNIMPGESVNVDYELSGGNIANAMTAPNNGSATKAFPNFTSYYNHGPGSNQIDKSELEDYKKFQMLDLLLNRKDIFQTSGQPIMVGYVSEGLLEVKVDGKSAKSNASHLIVLPVSVNNSGGGSFSFREEHLSPSVAVTENASGMIHYNGLDFGETYVYLGGGSYDFTYELPEIVDHSSDIINEIKVKLRNRNSSIEYFVVNQKKGELEPLENKSSIALEGNLADYISEQGTFVLTVKVLDNMDSDIQVPGVQVEGELKE